MKTLITIEVEHRKEIPDLAEKVAQRAYSLDNVTNAEVMPAAVKECSPSYRARYRWGQVALIGGLNWEAS